MVLQNCGHDDVLTLVNNLRDQFEILWPFGTNNAMLGEAPEDLLLVEELLVANQMALPDSPNSHLASPKSFRHP